MFLCTSKSKYGIKYDEAGSIVDEKLHDSATRQGENSLKLIWFLGELQKQKLIWINKSSSIN